MSRRDVPLIILVTPTYPRLDRERYLRRCSHVFRRLRDVLWVVVEDGDGPDTGVAVLLKDSGIDHVYLHAGPSRVWGNLQRDAALRYIREKGINGIVYFADDDNGYDVRLFNEIRKTRRVSIFPVGNLGVRGVERPCVKNGRITGWDAGWGYRRYPVDMAGFAFRSELLGPLAPPLFPQEFARACRGGESEFLERIVGSEQEFEVLCDNGRRCLVFHNQNVFSNADLNMVLMRAGRAWAAFREAVHGLKTRVFPHRAARSLSVDAAGTPVLSVITPTCNSVRFMECCLQNVIGQECGNIEHIIVDGGSTDGTVDVVRRYAENYPHIRWLSGQDRGQSDAMNKGLQMARGRVVGFLNVDDFYAPGVLSRALQAFEGLPEPSLVVGNCMVWGDDGVLLFKNVPRNFNRVHLYCASRTEDYHVSVFPVNPSAWFYHRSLHDRVGFFDMAQHYEMDLDFLLRAVHAVRIKYVDETWGNQRLIKGTKTWRAKEDGSLRHIARTAVARRFQELPWYSRLAMTGRWRMILLSRRLRDRAGRINQACLLRFKR